MATSFSCCVSKSRASIIWKIEDLPNSSIKSEEFLLRDRIWHLKYEATRGMNFASNISLRLNGNRLPDKTLDNCYFRYHFYLRDRNGHDVHKGSNDVSDYFSSHACSFGDRNHLLEGELADMKNNLLTVYCVLEERDKEDEIGTETESNFNLKALSTPFVDEFHSIFESGKFSDVTLRVGQDTFPCHKAILSSHSKVFETMFDSDMKENREDAVDLTATDPDVAKAMLRYIYTRTVDGLAAEKTPDLYIAADRYMLSELKDKCREFVLNHLSVDNVCEAAELADLYSDGVLTEGVEQFFTLNMRKILHTDKWKMRLEEKSPFYTKLLISAVLRSDFV